jgi:branched-chain amino acid transport system ATP-binding protein
MSRRSATSKRTPNAFAHAALAIADRAYVIETGAIALSGAGADLLHNEKVREAYLGM